jgi:hypothetical protein
MNKYFKNIYRFIWVIPILLSGLTHIWNPAGFPAFHPDEGVYLRRSLHVLNGLGPQDANSRFDHSQDSTSSYDHPYFGQLFLAGIFYIIGYPDTFKPSADLSSIERLFSIPRIIMGILSMADTFLIFRLSERRYNRTVAIASAIFFAVMPLTWFTRRIVLDSIQLPFLLLSLLVAIEMKNTKRSPILLSAISGALMGLAIFTKVPVFILIPLVIYLIYFDQQNRKKHYKNNLQIIIFWLVPMVTIASMWPIYATISGQYDEWVNGIFWQGTQRQSEGKSLLNTLQGFWNLDPVLFVLGFVGTVFCIIRRDLLPLLWIGPYFLFLVAVGWVTHFHLILILPALCIAAGYLVGNLPRLYWPKRSGLVSTVTISALALFGLVVTVMIVTSDVSSAQLQGVAFVAHDITNTSDTFRHLYDDITIVGSPANSWFFKYVFKNQHTFSHVRDTQPINTHRVILVVDSTYKHVISKTEKENSTQVLRLEKLYNNTDIVAIFKNSWPDPSLRFYPYT